MHIFNLGKWYCYRSHLFLRFFIKHHFFFFRYTHSKMPQVQVDVQIGTHTPETSVQNMLEHISSISTGLLCLFAAYLQLLFLTTDSQA